MRSVPALRAAEHDRRAHRLDDLGAPRDAVLLADPPEVVLDRPGVGTLRQPVHDRVVLVAPDEHVDRVVEGRGEEQRLTCRRGPVEQATDLGEEAHVGHAVGLVDGDDLDRAEVDVALADQVGEAAGARDDDVDASAQRLALSAEADAAVAGHRGETARARPGA